jgi:hypothetical protein
VTVTQDRIIRSGHAWCERALRSKSSIGFHLCAHAHPTGMSAPVRPARIGVSTASAERIAAGLQTESASRTALDTYASALFVIIPVIGNHVVERLTQ